MESLPLDLETILANQKRIEEKLDRLIDYLIERPRLQHERLLDLLLHEDRALSPKPQETPSEVKTVAEVFLEANAFLHGI